MEGNLNYFAEQGPLILIMALAVGAIWKIYKDAIKKNDELNKAIVDNLKDQLDKKDEQIKVKSNELAKKDEKLEAAAERMMKYTSVIRDATGVFEAQQRQLEDRWASSERSAGELLATINSNSKDMKQLLKEILDKWTK